MAISKEMQASTRTLAQPRQAISTGASHPAAGTRLPSHSRNNSHTHVHVFMSGALNSSHRITRRKSVTNTAANVAAVAAALTEAGDKMTQLPIAINSRRGTSSKPAAARPAVANLPTPPQSLPTNKFLIGKPDGPESAIEDDAIDTTVEEGAGFPQPRARRASDGQPVAKDGKKSSRVELRCDQCGKGYKHSSCLTKHLWEHTPQWSYTSKLLISKHQQVQLLEAASVLVGMNNKDAASPPESAKDFGSEPGSASPAVSGYWEQPDGHSSVDTTPPPRADTPPPHIEYLDRSRDLPDKYRVVNDFARSYQSTASNGFLAGSVPSATSFGDNSHGRFDRRPPSSGGNATGEADRDLAAAVNLLSCSIGSDGCPRYTRLPADGPPVPLLPGQYVDQVAFASTSFVNSYATWQMPESFTRGEFRPTEDVKMEDSDDSAMDDDDDDLHSRIRSEDEDDGVFGRMEE